MVLARIGMSGSEKVQSAIAVVQDALGPQIHGRIEKSGEQPSLHQQSRYHLFDSIFQLTYIQWYQGIPSVNDLATLCLGINTH